MAVEQADVTVVVHDVEIVAASCSSRGGDDSLRAVARVINGVICIAGASVGTEFATQFLFDLRVDGTHHASSGAGESHPTRIGSVAYPLPVKSLRYGDSALAAIQLATAGIDCFEPGEIAK